MTTTSWSGAVRDLDVLHEGGPLLFFRGGYGRFQL